MPILDEIDDLSATGLKQLDPTLFEAYVRDLGGVRNDTLSNSRVAVYKFDWARSLQIRIPLDPSLVDFQLLMGQAIVLLAQHRDMLPKVLLSELLLPTPSDVIRVRELGHVTSFGNIPLNAAKDILNGLKRIVSSAAHSVVDPQRFYQRLSNAKAEEFMDRCLLGQTERGSYVFTVLCPLNALPNPNPLYGESFTRQVTSRLMDSLERLSRCRTERDCDELLHDEQFGVITAPTPLVSANLCEGLIDLMALDGSSVEVGVEWSSADSGLLETPAPAPVSVRFESQMTANLDYLAKRLRPTSEDESRWLYGTVETCAGHRVTDLNQREGDVVVRVLDAEGELRNAKMDLSADDYLVANRAHIANQQIRVRGILHREGRGFRIVDVRSVKIMEQT